MEMILALLPMVYIFLSLFVLLECVLMLMISTTETYFKLLFYSNKIIDIIKFEKSFSKIYHRHLELIVKYNIG